MDQLKILCVGKEQSYYEKWDAAITFDQSSDDIDGIVYTIPNYEMVDASLVRVLLLKDAPVLILKMRAEDPAAVEAVATTLNLDSRLFVGDQYRLEPGALAVGEAVRSGMIGKIEHASWRAVIPMKARAQWMDNYAHMTLMDLCYHYFMTLYGYLGSFSGTVFAHSYAPSWMADEGYCSLLLRTNAGVTLNVDCSWGAATAAPANFFGECALEGALGRLWTDGRSATFTGRSASNTVHSASYTGRDLQPTALDCPAPRSTGWAASVDGFLQYLRDGDQTRLITFMQYMDVFRFQCAALESSIRGQMVEF